MFLRNYSRGVLKRETVLRVAENDLRAHELKKSSKMRKAEKVAAAQVHICNCCSVAGWTLVAEYLHALRWQALQADVRFCIRCSALAAASFSLCSCCAHLSKSCTASAARHPDLVILQQFAQQLAPVLLPKLCCAHARKLPRQPGQVKPSTRGTTATISCAICSWESCFRLQKPPRRCKACEEPLCSLLTSSTRFAPFCMSLFHIV